MFRKLFKRRNKAENTEPSPDIRSQRPSAGQLRVKGLNETLFLAPLPVYTGQAQISRRNFSEMNETYLELGGNNFGMVELGKRLAFQIWMVLCTAFFAPVLICLWLVAFSPPEIDRRFFDIVGDAVQVFATGSLLFIIPIGAFVYGMLSGVYASAKSYPIRFNRQRREVCYIDDTTHRVLIVPWESVVAWVASSQGITSYGAMRDYTFGMGLEDEEHDTVQFVLSAQPSDAHALGMWTSIRNYMEDGELVDTPNPMLVVLGLTPTEEELIPYEGLHTFEIERNGARFMGSLDDDGGDLTAEQRHRYGYGKRTPWPLRWWYVRRVLTFWKMPYLIAEWAHRKGRPTLPERVQVWSQPLPPEQWAKPSPALQKANTLVKTAMDKKSANFVDACKAAGLH
ncbi:DUF6708 domain-containing protein [Pseudomonas sp. 10S4]|uniref:DUF6708 domain-containing protein n=1 Tax=Pseudomonas sp. 10S4 TaxID=3048583 RepID=UPI002AC8DEAE|nr:MULTISPECIES: DUF6708 domain-containing protein [unclassified Pseudomonas]MEB0224875.1 hypothetical protein [Pseudomonas sp. 5S1]MEB0294785.1 hypothetical protein [Pseudomonas sp. 10S4]WPX20334.1 hypothetical protein RHM58_10675 [Pseudomonas sp. 10S4]